MDKHDKFDIKYLKKHRFESSKYEEWKLQIMSKKSKKQTKFGCTFRGLPTMASHPILGVAMLLEESPA